MLATTPALMSANLQMSERSGLKTSYWYTSAYIHFNLIYSIV